MLVLIQQSIRIVRIGPATHLTADHIFVLFPDIDTPIQDRDDVDRLLPYDIFQVSTSQRGSAHSERERTPTETEILQSELAGAYFFRVRRSFACSWSSIQKRNLH